MFEKGPNASNMAATADGIDEDCTYRWQLLEEFDSDGTPCPAMTSGHCQA